MGKKKGHPAHENLERWVVSYADFMTLLFATFTALYALTQAKLDEVNTPEQVMAGIRQGFNSQSLLAGIKSILQGNSPPAETTNPASPELGAAADGVLGDFKHMFPSDGTEEEELEGANGLNQLVDQMQAMMDELREEIRAEIEAELKAEQAKAAKEGGKSEQAKGQGSGAGGSALNVDSKAAQKVDLEVMNDPQGARIRISSQLLFASGTANLTPAAKKALHTLAETLKPKAKNYLIQVEGHTDSDKINSVIFPSNWELSAARASAVVRFLINNEKFKSEKLSATGYADTRPVSSNLTVESRAQNRRIEFLLYTDPHEAAVTKAEKTIQKNTPGRVVITPVSHQSNDASDELNNQGAEGQFHPNGKTGIHKQVVKSASTVVPKQGPVNVILQRTDSATGDVSSQSVPVVSASSAKPISFKPIMDEHSGGHQGGGH